MEGSLHNNITHYTIYITVVEKKWGYPQKMKMSQWKKFVLLTKNSLCILKNKHDQKENKQKKKMMFIYEKKEKKNDQTA